MDYCIHGRLGFCEFCNSEMEGIENRITKVLHRVEADESARERWQADLEFSRLPPWVQMEQEGDYSPWDAGMYPED